MKHRLRLLKLSLTTQEQIQQSLALHHKVLKETSSNFERNTILQPVYEILVTLQFGYVSPIQPQYLWPYNPHNQTRKQQEVSRISALEPLVVPETSQYQIPTNSKILPQNVNRSSQDVRQRTPMNPARNIPANTQTTISSCHSQPCPRNRVKLRYDSRNRESQVPQTNALT